MAMRRWDEQLIYMYSDRRTYLPLPSGFSALDPSAEAGAYRSTRLPQRQQSLCRLVFFSASSIKPRLVFFSASSFKPRLVFFSASSFKPRDYVFKSLK